jgi:tRNA A-37 threonylcarbamoyl transferase component Bud32
MTDPIEPLQFGNFQVLQRPDGSHWMLGEGGYGRTYKAKHRFLKRICALKIIHDRHMQDPEKRARFLQEARTAAQLSHPGVAQVYDFGEESGVVFYAMEFCEGGTVGELSQRRGPMEWAEVAGLARQMADGLACAHEAGLLHRDLKPQNVMLASTGEPPVLKLIDFGLVKVIAAEDDETWAVMSRDGGFKGNYATASPEQTGELPLDERSDLFSIGVILWWLLIGKSPFAGMSHAQLISDRLSRQSYASRLPADLDPAGREILAGLLEKNPDDRCGSARELSAALRGKAGSVGIGKRVKKPKPAPAKPPAAKSAPKLFEETFGIVSTLDETQAAKVYQCEDGAGRVFSALIPTPHAAEESVETVSKLACCGKNFGSIECFGEWQTDVGQPAFVFGEMGSLRLLDALKTLGDAPMAEVAPVLGGLASCIDRVRDDHGADLEINPHFLRVGGGGGTLDSWDGLTADSLRAFPRLHAGEMPADYSTDSTILSGDTTFPIASQFGALVYRLVSGISVPHAAYITSDAYIPAAALSEKANHFLERVIAGEFPDRTTGRILRELVSLEGITASWNEASVSDSGEAPVRRSEPAAASVSTTAGTVEKPPARAAVPELEPVPLSQVPDAAAPEAKEKPALKTGTAKRKLPVMWIVAGAVAACLAIGAWLVYQMVAGSGEVAGEGGGGTPGEVDPKVPEGQDVPPVGSVRVEFGAVEFAGSGIGPEARLVLCDRHDAALAGLEVSDGRAVAEGVPADLFDDSSRWPLRVELQSGRLAMEPVELERNDFQQAEGGGRTHSKAIRLDPRAFLVIAPVIKIEGREVELSPAVIRQCLHSADLAIGLSLRSDNGGTRVELPAGAEFPLEAVFSLPHTNEFSLELKESGQPVWDLRVARRTVMFAGLGNFGRLRYEPDLGSISNEELREVMSGVVEAEEVEAGRFEGGAGKWDLPAIDGTMQVAGQGGGWSFPLPANSRWMVLSEAERSGGAAGAEDAGLRELRGRAEQGDIDAQYELGLLYLDDQHLNEEASTNWFRIAAERGDSAAQHNLGLAHEKGTGLDNKNPREAAKWFSMAAKQNRPESQNSLGLIYQARGDFDQAEQWFQKAAELDYGPAAYNLALLYDNPDSGKADTGKVLESYRKAAELKYGPALFNLGVGYEKGFWGLEQDREKAREHYEKALENGYGAAEKALENLR